VATCQPILDMARAILGGQILSCWHQVVIVFACAQKKPPEGGFLF
jgi:hypothetical protein